jgi:dTDP-4-amino-4,6-dideoxygalactose transaminase
MKVPFVDLRAQHDELRSEIDTAFKEVVDQSNFIGGSRVMLFEKDFSIYCGVKSIVTCATGTDALKLSLMGAGISRNDEVITVSHTFIATVEAITMIGAFPAFIDIDGPTYHLSPQKLAEFLEMNCRLGPDGFWINTQTGRRVTAILPVHLYGMCVDMRPIMDLAEQYNLKVIEDACQAHGASYQLDGIEARAGSMGITGGFSFYPGKNLGAMGEGGAASTQNEKIAERMRMLRDHGQSQKYIHLSPDGWNSRLDSLQCSILNIKLKKLEEWNHRRRQVAQWYRERLIIDERIILPQEPTGRTHVYHLFVVRVPDRDRVFKELNAKEIGAGLHYPIPLHLQKAYQNTGYQPGDLPETEKAAETILSLPMFPHMNEEQVDHVCKTIREIL